MVDLMMLVISYIADGQLRRKGNMIGGGGVAGARGCEAADYPREASACEGQEYWGG